MKLLRVFAGVLSILMAFSLVGCGAPAEESQPEETAEPTAQTEAAEVMDEVFKYFAIGNSITKHQTCDYWWNEIGMAASSMEKDYVHVVAAGLEQTYANVEVDAYNFSAWEITPSADREGTYSALDPMLSADMDLITIQLSENANTTLTGFENDFVRLIRHVQEKCPDARIIVVDDFYFADRGAMKKSAADRCGLSFASLESIRNNSEYLCGLGTVVYGADGTEHVVEHAGVANHPGDKGMAAIAERILDAYASEPPVATDPNDELLTAPEAGDQPVSVGDNLIVNNGFEDGGGAWIEFGDTPVTITGDVVHEGEKAMLLNDNHAKYTTWIPVKNGESYKVGAWVYGKATLCSAMMKSGGAVEYSYYAEGGTDGQWTYLEGTLTISDSAVTQVDVTVVKGDGDVYVDDVFMGLIGGVPTQSQDAYKYLAVGNAITLQEAGDNWWNSCGMGASAPEKDYFHLVKAGLEKEHGSVDATAYNFYLWEVTGHDRVQTLQLLDLQLTEDLDLVTVQLSEYCDDITTFESDFEYMIDHIKEKCPDAEIVVIDDFWYADRSEIKKAVSQRSDVTFVSLAQIRGNSDYQCGMNAKVTGSDGAEHTVTDETVAKHPGDLGMKAIADAILAALK